MDNKATYLQMLQAIIARMAGNSFLLKGWSVTLVSALLALAADKSNRSFVYLAYLPVLMFWKLDGYFLRQERLFRELYDIARVAPAANIDFSMDTTSVTGRASGWFMVCLSRTLVLFHGVLFITVVLVTVIVLWR